MEQAAAQTLAVIIEQHPSGEAVLPAILRQGAEFGAESAALLKALTSTGLRISDGQWASICTSCPPPEVQPYWQTGTAVVGLCSMSHARVLSLFSACRQSMNTPASAAN